MCAQVCGHKKIEKIGRWCDPPPRDATRVRSARDGGKEPRRAITRRRGGSRRWPLRPERIDPPGDAAPAPCFAAGRAGDVDVDTDTARWMSLSSSCDARVSKRGAASQRRSSTARDRTRARRRPQRAGVTCCAHAEIGCSRSSTLVSIAAQPMSEVSASSRADGRPTTGARWSTQSSATTKRCLPMRPELRSSAHFRAACSRRRCRPWRGQRRSAPSPRC